MKNQESFYPAPLLRKSGAGLTLIELLIMAGVLAVVSSVTIWILNPIELFKQSRDARRISDLSILNLNIASVNSIAGKNALGSPNTLSISIPDSSSTCANLGLPDLPSGWAYRCVTSSTLVNIDGTGWVPIDFRRITGGPEMTALPIDPVNATSTGNYYAYVTGSSWSLAAMLESSKYLVSKARNDSGYDPERYEIGNNLISWRNAYGIVGYWKFDEGSGSTANDSSGYGNSGTLYNGPTWIAGKLGGALNFDGANDYVGISTISTAKTQAGWFYFTQLASVKGNHNHLFDNLYQHSANNYLYFSGTNDYISWVPSINTWYHLVLTYTDPADTNTAKLHVNGIQYGVNQQSGPHSIASISRISYGDASSFSGFIDDVRIYNRALSAAEINAIYNATR